MARIKHGTFLSNGGPTQDITGLGFRPGAVIIYQLDSGGTATTHAYGFSDFVRSAATSSVAATNIGDRARGSAVDRVIYRVSSSGAAAIAASTPTKLSNGFRLNYTAHTMSANFGYIAFEEDIQSSVRFFDLPASGSFSASGTGFKPSTLFTMWMTDGEGVKNQAGSVAHGFGIVDSSFNQAVQMGGQTATDGWSEGFTDRGIGVSSTASSSKARITSFNSNGFSGTSYGPQGPFLIGYLALGPEIESRIFHFNVAVDFSGSRTLSASLPFKPTGLFNLSRYTGTSTSRAAFYNGMGSADSGLSQSSTYSSGFWADSIADRFSSTSAAYMDGYGATWTGSVTSFNDNGVTINYQKHQYLSRYSTMLMGPGHFDLSANSASSGSSASSVGVTQEHMTLISSAASNASSDNIILHQQEKPIDIDSSVVDIITPNLDVINYGYIIADTTEFSSSSLHINLEHHQKIVANDSTLKYSSDSPNMVYSTLMSRPDSSISKSISTDLWIAFDSTIVVNNSYSGTTSSLVDIVDWDKLGVRFGRYKETYSNTGELRDLINYIFESEDEIFIFEDEQGYGVLVPERQKETLSHIKTYKLGGDLGVIINALFESEDSMFYFESEDEKSLLGPEESKVPQAFTKNYKQKGRF